MPADEDALEEVFSRIALPEARAKEPFAFVAVAAGETGETGATEGAGGAWATGALDDLLRCMREFFPIARVGWDDLAALTALADAAALLVDRLAGAGACAFISAGSFAAADLAGLARARTPVILLWLHDMGRGLPGQAEAARIERLAATLGARQYFLVDSSQDFYQQIFAMPFLRGRER